MKEIMVFQITINKEDITKMTTAYGEVSFIPFGGSVTSQLFTGTIRPGASDVQKVDASGTRHMCAKYIFEGVDQNNQPCHLFVENLAHFEPHHSPSPFHACPTFMSDSPLLNDYLAKPHFRAEGHPSIQGVDIHIIDILDKE